MIRHLWKKPALYDGVLSFLKFLANIFLDNKGEASRLQNQNQGGGGVARTDAIYTKLKMWQFA